MNARTNFEPRNHMISQVFVFVLLGVFAVLSTFMVLLSAQLYRGVVGHTEQTATHRILTSYVMNAVRANDATDAIYIDERNDIDMLVFNWDVEGELYETKVYCYDGMLRELFTKASQEFKPGYGEAICEADSFAAMIDNGLLKIDVTDGEGNEIDIDIALRCSQEANNE